MPTSAGLLLFRRREGRLELLVAHPGGPLFARRDAGAWSVPKGQVEPGEAPIDVARREFREETGSAPPDPVDVYLPLGQVRQASGKVVHAWGVEGDLDASAAESNTFTMEFPFGSGRMREFPEIDRVAWFDPDEARWRLNKSQAVFVDRLLEALAGHEAEVEPRPGGAADGAGP